MVCTGESLDIRADFRQDHLGNIAVNPRNRIQTLNDVLVGRCTFPDACVENLEAFIQLIQMVQHLAQHETVMRTNPTDEGRFQLGQLLA